MLNAYGVCFGQIEEAAKCHSWGTGQVSNRVEILSEARNDIIN